MKTQTKLRKAYKAPVELSEKTLQSLLLLSRAMTHLWNMALAQAEEWLEKKEKAITAYSFNYWLTTARRTSVVLKDGGAIALDAVSSDLEREVLRKLAGSYQSFFKLKKNRDARARKPGPKEEHWFQTLSWSSFTIEGGVLRVPGYDKERVEIPLGEYLSGCVADRDVVHATVAKRDGRFELSLVTSSDAPPPIKNPKFFRALDLGAGDIAVTDSDGSEFLIPSRRPDKFWRQQVRHIEARVRRRKKSSRGYDRLMKARRHIFNKSYDQHVSHQRKLARALAEEKVECLIIGKPTTRLGLAQSEGGTADQHWGAQNTGYLFRLLQYIKEKAAERGVKVIELPDPRRVGMIENPDDKFHATRGMLCEILTQNGLAVPTSFFRKSFSFKQ